MEKRCKIFKVLERAGLLCYAGVLLATAMLITVNAGLRPFLLLACVVLLIAAMTVLMVVDLKGKAKSGGKGGRWSTAAFVIINMMLIFGYVSVFTSKIILW